MEKEIQDFETKTAEELRDISPEQEQAAPQPEAFKSYAEMISDINSDEIDTLRQENYKLKKATRNNTIFIIVIASIILLIIGLAYWQYKKLTAEQEPQ